MTDVREREREIRSRRTREACAFVLVFLLLVGNTPVPAPVASFFHQDVAWSPDGKLLAFSELPTEDEYSPERWSVYTVGLDGSEPNVVATAARTVSWSPDGDRLVYAALRDGDWEILTSDPDGTRVSVLTDNESTEGAPAWSPDGQSIAFHSDRDGSFKIYVMGHSGGDVRQLTNGEGADYNPSWSTDGDRLVFYHSTGNGADQIRTVTLEGEKSEVTNDDNNNIFPAFRHDGRIVFSAKPQDGIPMMVHVAPDGSDRSESPTIETFFARYAPDGERIAFIHGQWPRSAIYVASPDGVDIRKLVN